MQDIVYKLVPGLQEGKSFWYDLFLLNARFTHSSFTLTKGGSEENVHGEMKNTIFICSHSSTTFPLYFSGIFLILYLY